MHRLELDTHPRFHADFLHTFVPQCMLKYIVMLKTLISKTKQVFDFFFLKVVDR